MTMEDNNPTPTFLVTQIYPYMRSMAFTCVYIYVCTYVCTCVHTCVHVCPPMFVYDSHVHICAPVSIYVYECACVCTCVQVRTFSRQFNCNNTKY